MSNTVEYIAVIAFFLLAIDFSMPYQMFSLENDELCWSTTKRVITLEAGTLSGLIVTLTNMTKLKQDTLNWQKDFLCDFQVNTSRTNNGLFAVIQNILFRSDNETNECLDYVEYRKNNISFSKRYCGQINMDFASPTDVVNLTPTINSFVEPSGILDVQIFISKKPLQVHRKLELEIVFTSYRYCYRNSTQEDRQCSIKYSTHCIYKNFFNDSYINCPYPGCVDETTCSTKMQGESKDLRGFKIAITSVVILVICALITCYLCRKFKKFCWAEDFTNSRSTYPQAGVELHEPARHQPNMYTIVPAAATGDSNKDDGLPPSYNSLFPHH